MVLASLKRHTEHLHRRVEEALDIPRRLGTVDRYRELLSRLYGFYEPFEERLDQVTAWETLGLDFQARRKAHLLLADLGVLGLTRDDLRSLARCESLPEPLVVEEALGCLYVLEGATLGGQVIRRHLERTLGGPAEGYAFFTSYGAELGRMWKEFCVVVESTVTSPEERRRAQEFAAQTFEAYEDWVAAPLDAGRASTRGYGE